MKKFVCINNYEVKVCKSGAGWYIGTIDESEGFPQPNCRCSGYYNSYESAQNALENYTFNRICMENDMCHSGCGCQVKEVNTDD